MNDLSARLREWHALLAGRTASGEILRAAADLIDAQAKEIERLMDIEHRGYHIPEPLSGWRTKASFSPGEKRKLRPIAETLAMLDGNAFFDVGPTDGGEWFEQYLPQAHALYEANGGDFGWAGEASFAKAHSSVVRSND